MFSLGLSIHRGEGGRGSPLSTDPSPAHPIHRQERSTLAPPQGDATKTGHAGGGTPLVVTQEDRLV